MAWKTQPALYFQRYISRRFLWLNSPRNISALSLLNQDIYPPMHRDEQTVWQAGSYSFLTPASTEEKNSSPHLSSISPYLVSFLCPLSFSLDFYLFYYPPLPYPSTPIHSLSLSPFPSLSFTEAHVSLLALHTITSIHQLSAYFSLATQLPFPCTMTTTPTFLHTHFVLQPHLISHPSGQLNVDPSHTCSPSPPLSSPKALYSPPPPPSPIPDVPRAWLSVFVERVRTKRFSNANEWMDGLCQFALVFLNVNNWHHWIRNF